MCLSALLTLLIGTASYSLARYGSSLREDPSAHVATFSVNYTHKELTRTGINGSYEVVPFTQGASTVVIQDVEPADTIDYYFSLSDTDGEVFNEVAMKIAITVTVRLEMMLTGGGVSTVYFSGWKSYDNDVTIASGAYLQLYSDNANIDKDILPPQTAITDIDYSGNTLLVRTDATGKAENVIGLTMKPYSGSASEYIYHLRFLLPRQEVDTESYVGARVYIDIDVNAEQAQ